MVAPAVGSATLHNSSHLRETRINARWRAHLLVHFSSFAGGPTICEREGKAINDVLLCSFHTRPSRGNTVIRHVVAVVYPGSIDSQKLRRVALQYTTNKKTKLTGVNTGANLSLGESRIRRAGAVINKRRERLQPGSTQAVTSSKEECIIACDTRLCVLFLHLTGKANLCRKCLFELRKQPKRHRH